MVPKVTTGTKTMKVTKQSQADDEYAESSDLEEDSADGGESCEGSLDLECGNDFLKAVETATNKRKLNTDDDLDVDINSDQDDNPEINLPPKKKKKKKKPDITNMKPPTAEEMTRLRETENLFHSNLFRMQIEEMIKEVRPKKIDRKELKLWLEKLKEFLLNIDDSEETPLTPGSIPKNLSIPVPQMCYEKMKVTCGFKKPLAASVVGSFNVGCCLGPNLTANVVVVMPKSCFLKEDYLNARYQRKRAFYLCHIVHALQKSDLVEEIRWDGSDGSLSPRLMLSPTGRLSAIAKVYVSAVPASNCFKLSRFTPDKNNIRDCWFSKDRLQDCRSPTPIYNSSVMKDLVLLSNEAVRLQVLENNNNRKDAILLLRVWLKQRQLDVGVGGFSGYLISMLVVALSLLSRLNNLMSSYQIVRNVWLFLTQSDWTKEGFTMCTTKQESSVPSLEEFHRHSDVVFVDPTGHCNIAAHVHRLTYMRVMQEAQLAVQCLDNPDMNSFQALFMTPMPFLRQYDQIISLKKKKGVVEGTIEKYCKVEEKTNHLYTLDTLFLRVVTEMLERGLGARVSQLALQLRPAPQWGLSENPCWIEPTLLLGLRLNPDTAYSVVEKGPPANEPQAAEFRSLWGPRCELRRFRDGTVCEAVVWAEPNAPLAVRRLITQKMAYFLLHERLGLVITCLSDQLEPLVTEKEFIPAGFEYGSGEEASLAAIAAFDQLAKQLREVPDLPLEVASVQGVSAVLRATEVFPPLAGIGKPPVKTGVQGKTCWLLTRAPGKAPDYVAPIEGVLQLGLSSKWPEDVEAVRRIRAAFNLHIAKSLQEMYDIKTQAYPDHFDILKEGFVFRIRVVYPREAALLKATTTPDGKAYYRDTPESLELEKYTVHLPKLTGALHGVQQQYPAFGLTCRLAKRWLSAQLVDSSHMPDVATELLVASLFLSPEPFHALIQPQPMFQRFLYLLAYTNWQIEPIIVNFNSDLKREDLTEIESQFRTERASLPPLFVATQYDRNSSVWTRDAPSLPVLDRVTNLAKESLAILETKFLRSALLDECKVVFRPPLELYDALIRLKPMLLPRVTHGVDHIPRTPYQLTIPQRRKPIPIISFDPAQFFLQELRDGYSDYALFFHDTYGGMTIGVLFKPTAFEKQEFKVSHVTCRKPVQEEKKVFLDLNFDAIIEDFYILGTGFVKTIDLSPKYAKKL